MQSIADYFFIAGLNPDVRLQPYFPQNKEPVENPTSISQYAYKCHILQHFPEHNRSFPFSDESTALVVMPNGLRFITDSHPLLQRARAPFRHAFIITRENGQRIFGYALLFPEEVTHPGVKATLREAQAALEGQSPSSAPNRFFTMKAIGVLSRWGFTSGFFGWLEDLWSSFYPINVGGEKSTELSVEAFVYNLLFEASLPESGTCAVVSGPSAPHYFFRPVNRPALEIGHSATPNWLPVFEYPLVELFQLFDFDNFIRLLTCSFLEHRIVLLSADYYRLMVVGEGLITLLLPFVWPHVYAPVLPATLTHFLDAPVPYIMGMRFQAAPLQTHSLEGSTPSTPRASFVSVPSSNNFGLASEANVCFIFIDNGQVYSTDVDLPDFPNSAELRTAIESILTVFKQQQQQHQQSSGISTNAEMSHSRSADAASTRSRSMSRNLSYETAPRCANSDILSTSTVIRRPQFDLGTPLMRRSTSYRLIEQIVRSSDGEDDNDEKPNQLMQHSATEGLLTLKASTAEEPLPETHAYPSEGYFVAMAEIARKMASRKELIDYSDLLKFNYALRELFLNHLAEVFVDFETFFVLGEISGTSNDQGSGNSGLQAFDKVGFLSECPETHMPFLSAFLETQMFASFLDTHFATLTSSGVNGLPPRCPHCGVTRTTPTPASYSTSNPPSPVADFLARVRVLKTTSLDSKRPSTGRLSKRFLLTKDRGSPSPTRGRKSSFLRSPLEGGHFCKMPSPHPLFPTKGKLPFPGLQHRSNQPGNFHLLEGSLLSRAPANRRAFCGSDSPKAGTVALPPPIPTAGPLPPSPLVPEETPDETTPHLSIGDHGVCEHCSAPMVSGSQDNQLLYVTNNGQSASRNPQMKGREGLNRLLTGPTLNGLETGSQSPSMAQAHWDFVDSLLDECKHRTKRMVIRKMGREALHLGHNYQSVAEIEENTLVSGLCDLLERIWSHGIQQKRGASAMWVHIQAFVERTTAASLSSLNLAPTQTPTTQSPVLPERSRKSDSLPRRLSAAAVASPVASRFRRAIWTPSRSRSTAASPVTVINSPKVTRLEEGALVVPVTPLLDAGASSVTTFLDDVEAVRTIASSSTAPRSTNAGGGYRLRTNIGLARAFVRLALEKKRLSAYLKILLSDASLLRELYSRHAFLRCEEEREQFLVHLMSLEAVDYFSFTRMLQKAEMLYRVAIIGSGVGGAGDVGSSGTARSLMTFLSSGSSANAWVCLRGHLGSSGRQALSKSSPSYVEFRHQNLGILNALQIGHDNSGYSPNMYVEAVLVVTPLTNHTYLFPCNHWLGRGVEDNSCERLLIGHIAEVTRDGNVIIPRLKERTAITGEDAISQMTGPLMRLYSDTILDPVTNAVLDGLANSVNRLAKHFATSGSGEGAESSLSLSALLCGDDGGLASALEAVFTHGLRPSVSTSGSSSSTSSFFSQRHLRRKARPYAWDFFERFVEYHTSVTKSESYRQHQPRYLEPSTRTEASQIGGFDVTFVTSPRFVRTLPRHSSRGASANASTGGPRNLDAAGRSFTSKTPRISLKNSTLPPPVPTGDCGWQSQPCSPGPSLARRQKFGSTRSIFALENFISTFHYINRTGAQIGKLGKFQRMVCMGCRDHTISGWICIFSATPPSLLAQLYDPRIPCFLVEPDLRESVQKLLSALNDFTFKLDPALLGCSSVNVAGQSFD